MIGRQDHVSDWWVPAGSYPTPLEAAESTSDVLPLNEYDYIIVSYSGGKDSTACVLALLDLGVPRERIELWHQAVDGGPNDPRFMDWPVTEAYCKAFAEALGIKILFQWKEGGFKGEMLRDNALTKPTTFELDDGKLVTALSKDEPRFYNTRLKFPMPCQNLSQRWCSAALKIDVATRVFGNDPRFTGTKTNPVRAVMLTGERREEGGSWEKMKERLEKRETKKAAGEEVAELHGRAFYAFVDRHKSTSQKRRVDQWRPVLNWTEQEVWDAIKRYRIVPHPAYYLGWSRLSCMPCVFGNPDQWASVCQLDPDLCREIDDLEHHFGSIPRYDKDGKRMPFTGTIRTRNPTPEERAAGLKKAVPEYVLEAASRGRSYLQSGDEPLIELAMGEEYNPSMIFLQPRAEWVMPRGAFKHSGGPL